MYRYKEWYGCEHDRPNVGLRLTPRQIAMGIVAREKYETENNIYIRRIADPAIFDKSRGVSVAEQMEPQNGDPGVYFEPGDHNRIPGKMQFHERLRFRDNGKPRLQVFDVCEDWIRCIDGLPYSQVDPEDVDTEAEDHNYDETRYGVMANPLPIDIPTRSMPRPFDPFADEVPGTKRRRIAL
jgi:hypothetical protein